MKLNRGFYYDLLDVDQQVLYRRIGKAIANMEESVSATEWEDMKKYKKIFMALSYDNPEFFYWNFNESKWNEGRLTLKYEMTRDEMEVVVRELRKERQKVLEFCKGEDVILRLYQYMAENVKYAYDELQQLDQSRRIYTIEGVFLDKKAVCLGIAQAVNYLLQGLHIPHILVTGEAKIGENVENHAWNMVQTGEQYRHMDVTAEICECKELQYKYYMLQDWELVDRKMPKNTYPPAN